MNGFKNLLILVAFITLLGSCGSNLIKEKKITVDNVSVSGEGGKYFKVVPGDYILRVVDDKVVISIKLEGITKNKTNKFEMGNLSFIPLDNTGAAVPNIGLNMHPSTTSEWDKLSQLLKGDVGKTVTISFDWSYFSDKKIQQRIMKETENFEITETDFTDKSATKDDVTENAIGTDEGGSENWDKLLDDYEQYTDQYISFWGKAQKGDQNAMLEYPALMEKSNKLSASIKDAQRDGKLSTDQLERMTKIQMKMLSVMSKK